MSRINKRIGYDLTSKSREGRVCYYDGRKALHNLGAGDMYYIPNFVKSRRDKDRIFSTLLQEVDFQQMFNFVNNTVEPIPRMISAQTEKKGSVSLIYRMSGCNESNIPTTDWSPTVKGLIDDVSLEIDQTKAINYNYFGNPGALGLLIGVIVVHICFLVIAVVANFWATIKYSDMGGNCQNLWEMALFATIVNLTMLFTIVQSNI